MRKARWVAFCSAMMVLGACDDDAATTSSSSSSTSASGSASSTGGSTSSASTGASMGGAGGATGAPFTSKGASSYESQTTLAATPQGDVVAAWIAFFADGTSSIGYAISRGAGQLWSAPQYVKAPDGRLASNPVLAVDSKGSFALAFLGFTASGPTDEHIYVSRLPKGDSAFGPLVTADLQTQRDLDKPSIAFDANDRLMLTWADFTGAPTLGFSSSTDGTTFEVSTIANDATFGNLAYLCVDRGAGPNAPIYLVHLRQGATLALRKSTDHGVTWPLLASVSPPNVVFQDPTCAVHGDDVVVAYASGMSGVSANMNSPGEAVEVIHSTNGGASFGAPTAVGKLAPADQVLFPRVSRDANGRLEVVFYEGVVDQPAKLVRASSADGAAWALSEVKTAGTFTLDRTIASWLGDYIGLASPTTGMMSSYADNSEGKAHVQFAAAGTP